MDRSKLGRYEFRGRTDKGNPSAKFWHVILNETTREYMVAWGPIKNGKFGEKTYTHEQILKKIREKINKGYVKKEGYDETVGCTSVNYITQVCTQE